MNIKIEITCYFCLLLFQLVPGYRGYTIDSIRQLTILDDIRISADEKHFFKGLSKLKGTDLNGRLVKISDLVSDLTNNFETILQWQNLIFVDTVILMHQAFHKM